MHFGPNRRDVESRKTNPYAPGRRATTLRPNAKRPSTKAGDPSARNAGVSVCWWPPFRGRAVIRSLDGEISAKAANTVKTATAEIAELLAHVRECRRGSNSPTWNHDLTPTDVVAAAIDGGSLVHPDAEDLGSSELSPRSVTRSPARLHGSRFPRPSRFGRLRLARRVELSA